MKRTLNIKTIALIGVMAAIICIMGPFSIPLPFSPVPITLTNLAIYLTIYVLGMKKGTISFFIYLLLGATGLPVFSGFSGGIGKLLGPTGGYLFGFIFMALICGYFIQKWFQKWYLCLAGFILGTAVSYLLGSIWLAYQCSMSFQAALMAGVIPFIPGDLIKIIASLLLGPVLRKALLRAHLIA
ncbi:MAG TPA: biotin transporter BioY [Lachnospiraceae bacterium]|nr:biotin transporter BioY [Lachnospiraceae bacterium]